MQVDDFDFDLPEERIALVPARPRDSSRLLCVGEGFDDRIFRDLPDLLSAGDVLVINTTKVLPAALVGTRPPRDIGGGGAVQVDINLHKALSTPEDATQKWAAFARPARRLRVGDGLSFGDGALKAKVISRAEGEVVLEFPGPREKFEAALQQAGLPPLPPYIARKRDLLAEDVEDYQTIFANEAGSVAAPTAGLHFTPTLMQALRERDVIFAEVTLHVGAGTFLPVSVDDTKDHKMHSEWGEVSTETVAIIEKAKRQGGRVIAVGTTSLRLLESAARGGDLKPFRDETDIFITPGFQFACVDGLITNFHLPRSTLFMLVCAFAGFDKMHQAYAHAVAENYRFYSYGDACYLKRHD